MMQKAHQSWAFCNYLSVVPKGRQRRAGHGQRAQRHGAQAAPRIPSCFSWRLLGQWGQDFIPRQFDRLVIGAALLLSGNALISILSIIRHFCAG
jgi:hypothetical protein